MSDASAVAPNRISWRMSWMKLQGQLMARRKALGLTQADLAERLGKNVSTIKRWESGHNSTSAIDIFQWAAALGIAITTEIAEGGTSATPSVPA